MSFKYKQQNKLLQKLANTANIYSFPLWYFDTYVAAASHLSCTLSYTFALKFS